MYLPVFKAGFKGVLGQEKFDIDIIASCDGILVFCECKNLEKNNPSNKVWGEIKEQFEQLIEKAKKYKAQIAILSSLTEKYPSKIKELERKHSDESLSVVLLDQEDLEKGTRWQTISDGETESSLPLSIKDFLPKQKHKKNRKKREWNRQILYGNFFNDVDSGKG